MPWRERLLLWTGPGLLAGITTGDWLALLRENDFAVDLPYLWRAAVITLGSFGNSLGRRREEVAFGEMVAATEVEPPVGARTTRRSWLRSIVPLHSAVPLFVRDRLLGTRESAEMSAALAIRGDR
jgi:hypothetical protein